MTSPADGNGAAMCRMIAAVGRFELGALKTALKTMALNRNTAYDHELRDRGADLLHDCGWGAAFLADEGLSTVRSVRPCFEDPDFDNLDCRGADLAVLHARRNRDRSTISIANTHPFTVSRGRTKLAFFHNGEVRDLRQLRHCSEHEPRRTTDSERLFLHLLSGCDDPLSARSLEAELSGVRDFTSLNCLLVDGRGLLGYAGMASATERPRYYTLWRGTGPGLRIVSSEMVEGFDVEWGALPDGQSFRFAYPATTRRGHTDPREY